MTRTALLVFLIACAARALAAPADCWVELDYATGNAWATAESTLRYSRVDTQRALKSLENSPGRAYLAPRGAELALVSASFSALRSHGRLQTWYEPTTGAALQSRRVGYGRDSRQKTHRFLADGVWRERHAPPENQVPGDPDTWVLKSSGLVPYPAGAIQAGTPVLTPILLIAEAAALALQPEPQKAERLVFTDTQLYRVVLHARPEERLDAAFSLETGAGMRAIGGERPVRRVDLRPHLLGDAPEEEPFSLLELDGEIALYIDLQTGVPLRIEGTWLRVGTVPVELRFARLREGCRP